MTKMVPIAAEAASFRGSVATVSRLGGLAVMEACDSDQGAGIAESLSDTPGPRRDLASAGWVVELVLAFADSSLEHRYFAVGLEIAADAEEAVLRYPGVKRSDPRSAKRPLAPAELTYLALKRDTIRPYGLTLNSRDAPMS